MGFIGLGCLMPLSKNQYNLQFSLYIIYQEIKSFVFFCEKSTYILLNKYGIEIKNNKKKIIIKKI